MVTIRSVGIALVVLLVVLAGCNTFGTVPTQREPFDVGPGSTGPQTESEPQPVIAFDPAKNATPDPWDLIDAHYRSLDGRSYTVAYSHRETAANGTVLVTENWTTRYGHNHSTALQTRAITTRNRSSTRQFYSNGTHVWVRSLGNESATNTSRLLVDPAGEPIPPEAGISTIAPTVLKGSLPTMNVTDVEALDTVPSTVSEPVYRVRASGADLGVVPGTQKRSRLTLYVSRTGQIVEYHHEYAYVVDGDTIRGSIRIEFRVFGVSIVDPPPWVAANASVSDGVRAAVHDASGWRASDTARVAARRENTAGP